MKPVAFLLMAAVVYLVEHAWHHLLLDMGRWNNKARNPTTVMFVWGIKAVIVAVVGLLLSISMGASGFVVGGAIVGGMLGVLTGVRATNVERS